MRQDYTFVNDLFNSILEGALAESGEDLDLDVLHRLQDEALSMNGWTFEEYFKEHLQRFDENPLEVFTQYSDACTQGLAIFYSNEDLKRNAEETLCNC